MCMYTYYAIRRLWLANDMPEYACIPTIKLPPVAGKWYARICMYTYY